MLLSPTLLIVLKPFKDPFVSYVQTKKVNINMYIHIVIYISSEFQGVVSVIRLPLHSLLCKRGTVPWKIFHLRPATSSGPLMFLMMPRYYATTSLTFRYFRRHDLPQFESCHMEVELKKKRINQRKCSL